MTADPLLQALTMAEVVHDAGLRNPIAHWRPTQPQLDFLRCRRPRVLLRGPNQPGKTTATVRDVLDRMLGLRWFERHGLEPLVPPDLLRRFRPPVQVWVVCSSWKQSLTIQRKMFELLPKDELHPDSSFKQKNGFSGQVFQTRNGSMCTFVTVQQDTTDLASATLHHIAIDEPPPEDVWGELVARVRHHRGQIKLTLTPINRPVEWLREKCDRGEIEDIHFTLTVRNCWPIGAARPFQTQEQIEQFTLDVPTFQRPQRVFGEWDGVTVDRWLDCFDEARHVEFFQPPPGATLGIGIDYGLLPGKTRATLIALREERSKRPEVWYWDETGAPEDETWGQLELADGIMAMLERNGLDYWDIDVWVGDRSAQGKSRKLENRDLRAALAAAVGINYSDAKFIQVPKKGTGSVPYGCAVLNGLFRRNLAKVHPRCRRLISFFNHFNGDPRHVTKDAGDSARYIVTSTLDPRGWFAFRADYA